MANNIKLIVYPASDLTKTTSFFKTYLGVDPYIEGEYYVGFRTGELEVGLDPNGSTVIGYIDTEDMESSLKSLTEAGAEVTMEPKDVGGGLLVAQVKLADNVLGLRQPVK